MIKTELNHSMASWDYQSKDPYIKIKIRRSTLIAFAISLVLHAAILFSFSTKKFVAATSVAYLPPKTLSIRIAGLPSKKAPPKTSHKEIMTSKQNVKSRTILPKHPFIVMKKEATPAQTTPLTPENNAPTDLMSYIKAKRQHAQDLEDNAAAENAAASANSRIPSADEQRDAIIKRNLQQQGTSGIFEIRRLSLRTGQFSFKGWKNGDSNARLEIIDVEAGADGNIELAIVKKMIEIIRREYKGDFKWESQRLGRVLVLSARMEDNAGLEDFLMQEFFTTGESYPHQ